MKHELPERRECSETEKAQWVSRYRKSGLGLRRFALEHNVRIDQLHYWIYGKAKKPRRVRAAVAVREVKWAELLPASPWVAELGLPAGQTLRLSAAARPAWVSELVRTLRAPC